VTIDSNILIGYLNDDRALRSFMNVWKATGQPFFLSTVSIAEVLSFTTLSEDDIERTEAFLARHFLSIDVTSVVAREAGRIRRQYGLKLPDAIIAATALVTNTPLASRDEDFRRISELELIVP
jgi:predicted nucleic acid-binding protein